MNLDQDSQQNAGRRQRGRYLAWLAAGIAVLSVLILLGPAPAGDAAAPRDGKLLLEQSAPVVAQHIVSLSSQIDWDAKEVAPDPSPLSVAAYER